MTENWILGFTSMTKHQTMITLSCPLSPDINEPHCFQWLPKCAVWVVCLVPTLGWIYPAFPGQLYPGKRYFFKGRQCWNCNCYSLFVVFEFCCLEAKNSKSTSQKQFVKSKGSNRQIQYFYFSLVGSFNHVVFESSYSFLNILIHFIYLKLLMCTCFKVV